MFQIGYNEWVQGDTLTSKRPYNKLSTPFLFRILTLLLILVVPLQAYIDPGGGFLFWQIAAAFVLGTVYQARKFLAKVIERVRKKS